MNETQKMNGVVLSVLLIGLILIIGIYIFATMQTVMRTPASTTIVNESKVSVEEGTGEILSVLGASGYNDVTCSILSVINATDGIAITSANYTISGCVIKKAPIATTGGMNFNNTNWNVTYVANYQADSETTNASGSMVTSLNNGSMWLTIIIIVAFAVIVLGLITSGLARSAEEEVPVVY